MKIGVYVGSFNPFTIGHASIVLQAERIFDAVWIVSAKNGSKSNDADFTHLNLASKFLKNRYHIHLTPGHLFSDYFNNLSIGNQNQYTLIRGLRNGYDLEYELNYIKILEDLLEKPIDVVFFRCPSKLDHVSSSMVRELFLYNLEKAKQYLPE